MGPRSSHRVRGEVMAECTTVEREFLDAIEGGCDVSELRVRVLLSHVRAETRAALVSAKVDLYRAQVAEEEAWTGVPAAARGDTNEFRQFYRAIVNEARAIAGLSLNDATSSASGTAAVL